VRNRRRPRPIPQLVKTQNPAAKPPGSHGSVLAGLSARKPLKLEGNFRFKELLGEARPPLTGERRPLGRPPEPAGDPALARSDEPCAPNPRPGAGDGDPPPAGRELELAEHAPRPEPGPDPIARLLLQAAPRAPLPVEPAAPPPNAALPQLEQLLAALVRRAAWGGDGRKGAARLEIGAGALEGATLQVISEGGELSIDLVLPPGAPAADWEERLTERLRGRGLEVREISVR
jgi:hypothetical protein